MKALSENYLFHFLRIGFFKFVITAHTSNTQHTCDDSKKRIWGKTVGLISQLKVRGLDRVNAALSMKFIVWNVARMINLQEQSA